MPAWSDPNRYGWLYHPASDDEWNDLVGESGAGEPFRKVLAVARAHGCRTVLIESRYIDADYRSEYSTFWSKRFDSVEPVARRVHFFRAHIEEDRIASLPEDHGYVGYSVLRPGPNLDGHIGRTVIAPPPDLEAATMATVLDEVSLFGQQLSVRGSPFSEQDGEFLTCAHAAIWAAHYSAYRRGLVGRRLTAELAEFRPAVLSPRRALPAPGMTLAQVQAVFDATGQPALIYPSLSGLPRVPGVEIVEPRTDGDGDDLPGGYWDTRLFSVICRYLNSGFPVMIANVNHAFILVGWFSEAGQIRFIACDDQQGPYEVIDSPFSDKRSPWVAIVVPLPPKVYMSGEMAETWGHRAFRAYGSVPGVPESWLALASALAVAPKELSLRTFLRDGRTFKAALGHQGRPPDVERELRLARLPHYVWVVEAHDRELRKAGEPSVIAEVAFDPNSSDHKDRVPRQDAISMPGFTAISPPDAGNAVALAYEEQAWRSHLDVGAC